MCGIVGVFKFEEDKFPEEKYLKWCLDNMRHRGPDSNGIWHSEGELYSTGFVRLAIRDLSDVGNQPMLSNCGNYIISYNGEIYNTDFLRKKLSPFNIDFRSKTDTEILLYLLKYYSPSVVLPWLDGIFAFSFYDIVNHKLILGRDQLGVKPLYIGQHENGIAFSSQYNHICNHRWIRSNSWNPADIGLYLQLGYFPSGHAPLKGSSLFPEGTYAEITKDNISFCSYYYFGDEDKTLKDVDFESEITYSIKSQLVSDVPIGTFLSGGVDSPIISALMCRLKEVTAYTIGIKESHDDESANANFYASRFNISHKIKHLTESDLLLKLDENFSAFSEPFADYSSIPTLYVSEFAKKDVTVVLSGDGPDELLWGYKRNKKAYKAAGAFKYSKFSMVILLILKKILQLKKINISKRHLQVKDFAEYCYRTNFISGSDVLLKRFFKVKPAQPVGLERIRKQFNKTDPQSIMEMIRNIEIKFHLPRILLKVDRASMYHSLEVRVPYLSKNFITYSARLNSTQCVHNAHGKMPLKEWLSKESGSDLCFEEKKGFTIPLNLWIKGELYDKIERSFKTIPEDWGTYFRRNQLLLILEEHKTDKNDWSWVIWSVYSLLMWRQYHINSYNEDSTNIK